MTKTAYICGPLTELDLGDKIYARRFYELIADLYQRITGVRAFVPHEHCDPVVHVDLKPSEVDAIERKQVCELTSVMVVVALAPSWGGGIEVEMANHSGVPVVVLCEQEKLASRGISRLLRGNPAVKLIISYKDELSALSALEDAFKAFLTSV